MEKINVAILGASGAVGREMLKILEEYDIPVAKLLPLASARSAGGYVKFHGEDVLIEEATDESFAGMDYVLGAVKNEFEKFGDILAATQQRMDQANRELDKLVGVRTRSIIRKLKDVEKLDDIESMRLLGDAIDEQGGTSI